MTIDDIQQQVGAAKQIQIIGSGSQIATRHSSILDMSQYTGLVDYYPEELLITVKAGTSIKYIEQILSANAQVLAFDVPNNDTATIGGAYAIGSPQLSDAVLGVKIIDGQGRLLNFGGQVMKNVAGYDVSRLLVGSRGKLAVICEISFKVIPKAYASQKPKQKISIKPEHSSEVRTRIEQGLKTVFDPDSVFI